MTGPAPHDLEVRVYYQDTDAGGIVYHANYLDFAERARTEMLRQNGFEPTRLRHDYGLIFALRRCTMRFDAPARLDDLLTVRTHVIRIGGARMVLRQEVLRAGAVLAVLDIELAVLTESLRPARVPSDLRRAIEERFGGRGAAVG